MPTPPLTVPDIAERLTALGVRIPADAERAIELSPTPKRDEIRSAGGRLIALSGEGIRTSDGPIDLIVRRMHALAQKTDPAGAPSLAPGPDGTGTRVTMRDSPKTYELTQDPYAMKPFLDELARLFHEHGWPWRFVASTASVREDATERLLLVPAATLPRWAELTFLRGGTTPAAVPTGDASPVELPRLRAAEEILGEEHYLVGDLECVDAPSDYARVVADIAQLCGPIDPIEVSCIEKEGARHLTLAARGLEYDAILTGDTDWLDLAPLLACLNRLLADAGAPGRLYDLPNSGQGFAVGYATAEQAATLEREGYALLGR
jgi:hypothetical protein